MSSSSTDSDDNDANVQMWRMKKQIEALERARGNGTSMISLIIPPKDQISRVNKMLGDEYGTASNIKSRVNRLSVLSAITSAQQKLKLFSRVPDNGLCIFCGEIVTEDGKEKKLCLAVEPIKTINTSLYMCDNRFHTEALRELLENDKKFGFIVMDGSGSLFGTLSGSQREVLHRINVDLPKKHGRGGQSALRFARLRLEKRHNYVRKIAELAVQFFITNDRPNVAGLILAGLADFKTELSASDLFDPRLQAVIIKIVDVSYGGENGFNQAIEQSAEILQNVKFLEEKKIIGQFFEHIALDTGRYCFGIEDTLKALIDMQAIERLIVYEGIEHVHYRLKHPVSGEERELTLSKEDAEKREAASFTDQATGDKLEVVESMTMLEWLATNYKRFGARLDFVTDKSQEGSQFVKGFGGIGGILRYKVDFTNLDTDGAPASDDDDPDGDFI